MIDKQTKVETNQSGAKFLDGLDVQLRIASISLGLQLRKTIAIGRPDIELNANLDYIRRTTVDQPTIDSLQQLRLSPDPTAARYAMLLNRELSSTEAEKLYADIASAECEWKMVRKSVDPMYSVDDLHAMASDSTLPLTSRRANYDRAHQLDVRLVNQMMVLRDKRNLLAKHFGFDSYYIYQLLEKYDIKSDELETLLTNLYEVFGAIKTKRFNSLPELEKEFKTVPKTSIIIKQLISMFGLDQVYEKLEISDSGFFGGERARCIPINIPNQIALYIPSRDNGIEDAIVGVHEFGHGVHFASIDSSLPFVFRDADSLWTEAMAIVFEDIAVESGLLTANNKIATSKLIAVKNLNSAMSAFTSIANLMFEKKFYGDPNASTSELRALYLKLFEMEDRSTEPSQFWSNDMYLAEYPIYCLNYIFGYIIAAQIEAYGKNKFKSISSKEFMNWLLINSFKLGRSKSWRQMLIDLTEEDMNPEYFIKKITLSDGLLDKEA